MELSTIKHVIENNENLPSSIIFKCVDNAFIPESYIDHLKAKFKINYIQSLDYIVNLKNDIFSEYPKDTLFVYKTDILDNINPIISEVNNLIIICHSVDKSISDSYDKYIVTVPKLESWQIEDYIKSTLPHTQDNTVKYLQSICKDDIYRINLELDKLRIFNMSDRDFLVDKFFSDNVFSDLSNLTIFNFTNSIITKNVETLKQILLQFDSIDIEPIGVITVLYKNFKNILNVQLNSNPTPENTGLSSKQIWGIKNNSIGYFSKESLIDVFQFILSLDFKVKTGELPIDMLIDYVIVKVFNA